MSDKTNQATPTPKQLIERVRVLINSAEECSEYRDTASWGFEEGVLMTINEATTLADLAESAPSILAENEKLRKEYDECFELMRKNLNDFLSSNEENEKLRGLSERIRTFLKGTGFTYLSESVAAEKLCDEITAALSGEQEGHTPKVEQL